MRPFDDATVPPGRRAHGCAPLHWPCPARRRQSPNNLPGHRQCEPPVPRIRRNQISHRPIEPRRRVRAHPIPRQPIPCVKRLDVSRDLSSERQRSRRTPTEGTKKVARLQFLDQVIRPISEIRRIPADRIEHRRIPRLRLLALPHDGDHAPRNERMPEPWHDDRPLHPMQTLPSRNQRIGRQGWRILGVTLDPVQIRVIASRHLTPCLDHDWRRLDRINPLNPRRQSTRDLAGPGPHVENHPRISSHQIDEDLKDLGRIRRAMMIGRDDTRIAELRPILRSQVIGLWPQFRSGPRRDLGTMMREPSGATPFGTGGGSSSPRSSVAAPEPPLPRVLSRHPRRERATRELGNPADVHGSSGRDTVDVGKDDGPTANVRVREEPAASPVWMRRQIVRRTVSRLMANDVARGNSIAMDDREGV